jgi:hypothetical protein
VSGRADEKRRQANFRNAESVWDKPTTPLSPPTRPSYAELVMKKATGSRSPSAKSPPPETSPAKVGARKQMFECWHCQAKGHIASNCPVLVQQVALTSPEDKSGMMLVQGKSVKRRRRKKLVSKAASAVVQKQLTAIAKEEQDKEAKAMEERKLVREKKAEKEMNEKEMKEQEQAEEKEKKAEKGKRQETEESAVIATATTGIDVQQTTLDRKTKDKKKAEKRKRKKTEESAVIATAANDIDVQQTTLDRKKKKKEKKAEKRKRQETEESAVIVTTTTDIDVGECFDAAKRSPLNTSTGSLICVFCKATGHTMGRCPTRRKSPVTSPAKVTHPDKVCHWCGVKGHIVRTCPTVKVPALVDQDIDGDGEGCLTQSRSASDGPPCSPTPPESARRSPVGGEL